MKRLYTEDNIDELKAKSLFNDVNHFKKEKDLSDYIERNIENVCLELFDDKYISHQKEVRFPLEPGKVRQGARGSAARLDLLVVCEKKKYALELKNPKNVFSEITRSIGQLWLYKYLLDDDEIDIVIITTKHDHYTTAMIDKYNMPFRYIVFNKERSAEFTGMEAIDDRQAASLYS